MSWILLMLLACADKAVDDTGPSGACSGEPELEIGGGEEAFETMNDGDVVTMVHGVQNGWHILVSLRAWNVAQIVKADLLIESIDDGGVVVGDVNKRIALVPDGDCQWVYPGIYGFLEVDELSQGTKDTPPELLAYKDLRITLTIEDTEGKSATDVRVVVAGLDAQDIEGD